MDEEYFYLTLRCSNCDCPIDKCDSNYVYGKTGCIKKISEEDHDKWLHYQTEILPFIRTYKNTSTMLDTINEIYDFCQYIYDKPTAHKVDRNGKTINSSF